MAAGFAGRADDEIEIAGEFHFTSTDKFHRSEHRRQAALLFTGARPHTHSPSSLYGAPRRFPRIRILHRARRRAHPIANEHQAIGVLSPFDVQNQISLFIDEGFKPDCSNSGLMTFRISAST
jgi:hypothetical protein